MAKIADLNTAGVRASDEELAAAVAQQEGQFSRGLRSGSLGMGSQFNTLASEVAQRLGATGFAAGRAAAARDLSLRAAEAAPRVGRMADVHSLRDAGDYAAGLAGGMLPLAGAGLAATLLTRDPTKAAMLAAAPMVPLEAGDILQRQQAQGQPTDLRAAALGGLGSAAVQGVMPGMVRARMGGTLTPASRMGHLAAIPENAVLSAAGEGIKQGVAGQQLDGEALVEAGAAGGVGALPFAALGTATHKGKPLPAKGPKEAPGAAGEAPVGPGPQPAPENGPQGPQNVSEATYTGLSGVVDKVKGAARTATDRVAKGLPADFGDLANLTDQAQIAARVKELSDATVPKVKEWGDQLLKSAGLTDEQRQQVKDWMADAGSEASRIGIATMKQARDRSGELASQAKKLYQHVSKEVEDAADWKGLKDNVTPVAQHLYDAAKSAVEGTADWAGLKKNAGPAAKQVAGMASDAVAGVADWKGLAKNAGPAAKQAGAMARDAVKGIPDQVVERVRASNLSPEVKERVERAVKDPKDAAGRAYVAAADFVVKHYNGTDWAGMGRVIKQAAKSAANSAQGAAQFAADEVRAADLPSKARSAYDAAKGAAKGAATTVRDAAVRAMAPRDEGRKIDEINALADMLNEVSGAKKGKKGKAKKSEMDTAMGGVIRNHVMQAVESQHPGVQLDADTINHLADAVRHVLSGKRLDGRSAEILHHMFGPSYDDVLVKLSAAAGADGHDFAMFESINEANKALGKRRGLLDTMRKHLKPELQDEMTMPQLSELADHLSAWATRTDRGNPKDVFYDQKVAAMAAEMFDKPDAVFKLLEKENEPTKLQASKREGVKLSDEVDEVSAKHDEGLAPVDHDNAPKRLSPDLVERDSANAKRMIEYHRKRLNPDEHAIRWMLAKEFHKATGTDAPTFAPGEEYKHGYVVAEPLKMDKGSDRFTKAKVREFAFDSKKGDRRSNESVMDIGPLNNGAMLDARKLAALDAKNPDAVVHDTSNAIQRIASTFAHNLAGVMDHLWDARKADVHAMLERQGVEKGSDDYRRQFNAQMRKYRPHEIPDKTVLATIGGRDITYGEIKMYDPRTSADRIADADKARLVDLRKQYAEARKIGDEATMRRTVEAADKITKAMWKDVAGDVPMLHMDGGITRGSNLGGGVYDLGKLPRRELEGKALAAEKRGDRVAEQQAVNDAGAHGIDPRRRMLSEEPDTGRTEPDFEGNIHVAASEARTARSKYAKLDSGSKAEAAERAGLNEGEKPGMVRKFNMDGTPVSHTPRNSPAELTAREEATRREPAPKKDLPEPSKGKTRDQLHAEAVARNAKAKEVAAEVLAAEAKRMGGMTDDHLTINVDGHRYEVQQLRPGSFVVRDTNGRVVASQESTPDPKALAAKKAAFVEKARSGDADLIESIAAETDPAKLQRAAEHLVGEKMTPEVQRVTDALNERIGDLVRDDPDAAYSMQRTAYTASVSKYMRGEVRKYVDKVLGKTVKTEWARIFHAGEFARTAAGDVIRVSVHALDPRSVAYHESLHAFFAKLDDTGNKSVKAVLMRAADSPMVRRQLERLLANEPKALKQLADAEERVAYMYQFWNQKDRAGNRLLQIGPETRGVFTKIADFFRRVMGLWTNDERALHILEHFSSGEYAKIMHDGQAVNAAYMHPGTNRVVEAAKRLVQPAVHLAENVMTAGGARLRDSGVPALRQIADAIKPSGRDATKDAGFIASARIERTKVLNALAAKLEGHSESAMAETLHALQGGTAQSADAKAIVKAVRATLDGMHAYMTKAGVKVNHLGPDYFPRVYDADYISRHQQEFRTLLERHGVADPQKIIDKIMSRDGTEFQVVRDVPGMQFMKQRKLDMIPDAALRPFMQKDLHQILNSYVTQATRRAEWVRRFGEDGKKLNALLDEARQQGASAELVEYARKYTLGVDGTLGDELNPTARRLMGDMIVYQNIRLLPLGIFSSMIDPAGIMVRGGTVGDAWSAFKRGIREMTVNFNGEAPKDSATELAATLGVIDRASLVHALGASYTQGMVGDTGRKINNMFFRFNMMEQFNSSMRVAATEAAVNFIGRHADGTASKHSGRWLVELGLSPSDIQRDASGRVKLTEADGLTPEQAAKMRLAVNRWVDGAVLRPDAADKPVWMNDPHFMLVAHLKQFVYSFHETILKRIAHEVEHGNYNSLMAMASYVPIMMAADFAKGFIIGGGSQPDWKDDWGPGEYVWSATQRAGLLGVSQFGVDAVEHVGSLAGPTLEQLGEAVKVLGGREQFSHFAIHSLPANALYSQAVTGHSAPDPTFAD